MFINSPESTTVGASGGTDGVGVQQHRSITVVDRILVPDGTEDPPPIK